MHVSPVVGAWEVLPADAMGHPAHAGGRTARSLLTTGSREFATGAQAASRASGPGRGRGRGRRAAGESPAVVSHLTRAHPLAHARLSLQNTMESYFAKVERARFMDSAFSFDPYVMIGVGAATDKKGNNQRGNWHKERARFMDCGGGKRPMDNRDLLGRRVRQRSAKTGRGAPHTRAPWPPSG